jgi:demethylmenaquinone methyltransferase / 2-methoxy-6-polyprenyl-1,4-benzoquinol methylase
MKRGTITRNKDDIVYRITPKGEQIRNMFGAIAPRYDFLNRLLSLGIDRRWRRVAVGLVRCGNQGRVLDVATGTGDVALTIAARTPSGVRITGIDFCAEMVAIGTEKVSASPYRERIELAVAPCEEIPFPDESFDSVTIAFGIRNVVDRPRGLAEMYRILKPGGNAVILEFSTPVLPLFKALYHWYFLKVLPAIGGMFSQKSAYQYLPDSVLEFPSREEFKGLMAQAGFRNPTHRDLTFGIATIYCGDK